MNKKTYISIAIAIVCVIAVGIIYITSQGEFTQGSEQTGLLIHTGDSPTEPEITQTPEPTLPPTEPELYGVYIVGEVNNPGVFFLPAGSRVIDVLNLAGGETEDADMTRVNLALTIKDEMQIIIPSINDDDTIEPFIFAEETSTSTNIQGSLVNINTASREVLETLPGIGPARANAIVSYRENHGNFSSIEGLLQVSGIGSGILSSIRDFITVGG